MISERIQRLEYLCKTIPLLLEQINKDEFRLTPVPGRWSKKEILGHLIDSATNNHQRFVRAQFEEVPLIIYDQNKWNQFSYHAQIPTSQLISFWLVYNLQIAELVKNIPANLLQRKCDRAESEARTLAYVFDDYVEHLEHHLRQIVDYH